MKKRQRIRKTLILLSFFIFPATYVYLSPVVILMAGSQGIINGSFIVFVVMFLSAILIGRGFCGWLCPAGGCQESIFAINNTKIHRGNWLKWVIWIPWIGAVAATAAWAGGYRETDFFYMTTHGVSVADLRSLAIYLLVLFGLIALPALVVGKRSFCHHLCWMAPFMILGSQVGRLLKAPSLHLQADADICAHCHTCTTNCPMSLPVEEMVQEESMEHTECILCGTCVDGCKKRALRFSWKKLDESRRA